MAAHVTGCSLLIGPQVRRGGGAAGRPRHLHVPHRAHLSAAGRPRPRGELPANTGYLSILHNNLLVFSNSDIDIQIIQGRSFQVPYFYLFYPPEFGRLVLIIIVPIKIKD